MVPLQQETFPSQILLLHFSVSPGPFSSSWRLCSGHFAAWASPGEENSAHPQSLRFGGLALRSGGIRQRGSVRRKAGLMDGRQLGRWSSTASPRSRRSRANTSHRTCGDPGNSHGALISSKAARGASCLGEEGTGVPFVGEIPVQIHPELPRARLQLRLCRLPRSEPYGRRLCSLVLISAGLVRLLRHRSC